MANEARGLVFALLALPVCAAPARYYVKPVYTSLRFSIVKWGVLKEEGIFRDFDGTLDLRSRASRGVADRRRGEGVQPRYEEQWTR